MATSVYWIAPSRAEILAGARAGVAEGDPTAPAVTGQPVSPLRDPLLVAAFVASALIQSSHGMLYGFATLHWSQLGFSGTAVGTFWAVGVIAEIGLFAVSGRVFAGLGPGAMVVIGGAAATFRWAMFPLATSFLACASLQALHALTYACCHLGIMRLIVIRVPDGSAATAQGLYTTMNGLMLALVTFFSGQIFRALGGDGFATMAGLGALGAAVAVLTLGFGPIYPQSSRKGGRTIDPS